MEIRTSTIAVIAASCITVGGAAAYLASRSSPTPQQQTTPGAAPATAGVEQSEAEVADAPPSTASDAATKSSTDTANSKAAASTPAPAPRVNSRNDVTRPTSKTATSRASRPAPTAAPVSQQARASVPDAKPTAPAAPATPATRSAPDATATAPLPEVNEPKTPPAPRFLDLVVSTDSVLGLQVETAVSSEKARVEDEVLARVTRDVRVGDRVAIPAGSQVRGEVTLVERGGKVRDKARLGIRFTSVVLADGTRVPIETETIYREGDSPSGESTAKIGGGAIGGAIIGGIFGGAKGAAIGAATGAGAGTAAVMAGGRNAATLPSGTPVTVRVTKPATVTVEE